ncbi:MAG: NYN domain-containing protein [Sphingobium phenoxybenzoativorans]|uniref:NYN domain-containing protein n=1 Tax=Sphingobium phenoxybenzoativorans TaxID=1592790 RepID=A0A975K2U2_9SPHN|nr:NYN domain-containing protein [Sphingobium phenoxybenzoativorans]QUT03885.1 NYN domain-containing protein [Sphingobium phenoxybenzoativorans]
MSSNGAPSGNVALLIDADNASAAHFDPVLTVLAELGTVNIRRAYGNWSKPALKTWANLSITQAIEPQQQFDLTKGKNATDMKMTIDAMDLLFSGRVQGFGLMSSDSDFTPLVTRIRQDGIPVYGFGTANTPEGFRRACTRFIDVAALGGRETAPAEASQELTAGAAEAPAPLKLDDELIKLLVDAYDSAKRDERGFALLGTVGQLAGNRSSFDSRNYGFKRLSDLMEAVPNFVTEKREGGQVYVKRVR